MAYLFYLKQGVMMQIKYMKMPVSQEEKRKLNAQGFKIVDERFNPNPQQEDEKPKKARLSRSRKES